MPIIPIYTDVVITFDILFLDICVSFSLLCCIVLITPTLKHSKYIIHNVIVDSVSEKNNAVVIVKSIKLRFNIFAPANVCILFFIISLFLQYMVSFFDRFALFIMLRILKHSNVGMLNCPDMPMLNESGNANEIPIMARIRQFIVIANLFVIFVNFSNIFVNFCFLNPLMIAIPRMNIATNIKSVLFDEYFCGNGFVSSAIMSGISVYVDTPVDFFSSIFCVWVIGCSGVCTFSSATASKLSDLDGSAGMSLSMNFTS